jgi:hypothetical protein
MGSVANICGVKKTVNEKPSFKELLKHAFMAGNSDMQRRYDFLKLAEELGEEEGLDKAVDEAAAEIALEEEPAIAVEPEADGETELIEELIRAISDPTTMSDEDEDATLRAAEAVENSEKAAGVDAPTVADYVNMRMGW